MTTDIKTVPLIADDILSTYKTSPITVFEHHCHNHRHQDSACQFVNEPFGT